MDCLKPAGEKPTESIAAGKDKIFLTRSVLTSVEPLLVVEFAGTRPAMLPGVASQAKFAR